MSSPARTRALYEYIESLPEGYTGESIRLPPFEAVAIRPPWN